MGAQQSPFLYFSLQSSPQGMCGPADIIWEPQGRNKDSLLFYYNSAMWPYMPFLKQNKGNPTCNLGTYNLGQ